MLSPLSCGAGIGIGSAGSDAAGMGSPGGERGGERAGAIRTTAAAKFAAGVELTTVEAAMLKGCRLGGSAKANAGISQCNSSSKYCGVTWNKQNGNWLAQIKHDYQNYYCGSHGTELAAALAYDKKAREPRGPYTQTANFPWMAPQ